MVHRRFGGRGQVRGGDDVVDDACFPCTNPTDYGLGGDGQDRFARAGTSAFFRDEDFCAIRCVAAPSTFLMLAHDMDDAPTQWGRNDEQRVQSLVDAMRQGKSISPPYLKLQATASADHLLVWMHDGRHRCMACTKLGCRRVHFLLVLDADVKAALLLEARGRAKFVREYTVLSQKHTNKGGLRHCALLAVRVSSDTISATLTAQARKCMDPTLQAAQAHDKRKARDDPDPHGLLHEFRMGQAAEAKARKREWDAALVQARAEDEQRQATAAAKMRAKELERQRQERDRVERRAAKLQTVNAERRRKGLRPLVDAPPSDSESDSESEDVDYSDLFQGARTDQSR
jgi:hypothetical protein